MGETLRILMLEDVPSDAELVEIELHRAGIDFVALRVESEPEFRQALADFQPDLILADYALPSFNALEALRILNQQSLRPPFLLVTGSQSEEIAAQVMKAGAQDYLLKSSLMRLPSAVRNALERKTAHRAKLQVEEALRLSEARYRLMVQSQQDLVVEVDMENHLLFVNRAYCAFFGKTEEELIGSNFKPLIHPDDFPLVSKSIASLSAPPYECSFETRAKTPYGWRWLSWTNKAILNDQGVAITVVGTGRDITVAKEAKEALQESEERFRTITEQTSDVVFITDARGMITYLSPATTKVFGFELDEMLGHLFSDLLSPDSVNQTVAAFRDGVERGIPCRNLELKMKRKDGSEFYGELTGSFFQAGSFTGIAGTIRDITKRKQLEQAVEKARADFLFAVSHELKTPLHVMGTTQEMIESLPQEQQFAHFRDYSDVWRRNLMRLRFIIENLVDSQRPPGMGLKLEQQPADLMDLAQEIAGELEPVASARSVQILLQGESLPLAPMDSDAVRRLLENLLTNAIKFSHLGGQVEIRLRTQDEMICLDVCDFGMGIDPQIKPFLFQPFYRSPEALKAGVQGTGLGLYVSKMIAEAHGGTIQLESEPGKGTTVTVRLPLG